MDCVGIDRRLEKLTSYLSIGELNNVKILGICGMGGIGKTTLASVLYGKMYPEFEGGVFLSDVRTESRKHGLLSLQNKFLSAALRERRTDIYNVHRGISEIRTRLCRKRLLVVLDDVDDVEQLESLVGDREWFGPGSRIVITTRDEHLVTQHGADEIYRVDLLNLDEAFQLFCLKAFKKNSQKDQDQDIVKLSYEVVNYASGLPLAINVLASSLYGRSVKEWESALERLKAIPNEKIMCKLQISFDGLEEIQKKIFLDIACFFVGKKKDYVIKVLGSCGFHPDIGLKELVEKALITISNGQVWMHDLLQELGQDIVNRESRKEAGQRSRIWLYEDFNHILMNDTGSEQIEGIVLDLVDRGEGYLSSAKGFMKMKYVSVLILQHVQFLHDLEYLSNELKYLEWYEYPFKSLPSTFQPNKLVELHMRCSRMEQLWKAVKPAKSLKIIDLSYSRNLMKTLDFTEVPNLEELNLEGCIKLCEVHHSVGVLKRLVSLNLKDCKTLVSLPSTTCNLKSLKILILSGCLKLTKLPERLGDVMSLEVFDAAGVGSEELPLVETGDCMHRYQLASVLPCLTTLPFLRKLNLSGCNLSEGTIPNDLTSFPLLENLDLSGNDFLSLPSSICQLSRLTYLSISKCKRLQYLPDLPSSIEHLSLERCISLKALPNLSHLSGVTYLYFENCKSLQSLPDLPLQIEHLDMRNCTSLQTLPNLVQLSALRYLEFLNCTKLQLLPDLSSSIIRLDVENCTSLQTLPNLFEKQNLEKRFYIGFLNCSGLNGCEGKFSMTLTWLKSYLLWIQEVRQLC